MGKVQSNTAYNVYIAKEEYPFFDTILHFRDHNTLILYLLYYTNFYTIIILNLLLL